MITVLHLKGRVLRRLHRLKSGLLVLVMLPVVAKDGQCIGDAVGRVLHLQLHWVLSIVHLLVILGLLDGKDSLLSIRLLRVNGKDHVIGDKSLFRLLASLI